MIAANGRPGHTTPARFHQSHERALADLFADVLSRCADAGLVSVGVVAVDGTKLHANAAQQTTRNYTQVAAEILAEADAVDRAEDQRYTTRRVQRQDARGLPAGLPRRPPPNERQIVIAAEVKRLSARG